MNSTDPLCFRLYVEQIESPPRGVSFTNHEQVATANEYMKSNVGGAATEAQPSGHVKRPSALVIAVYAVTLLEDHPLFNSGHGSVFTRDGTNELEASVMVSKEHKKRCVGVMGLRNVRNPIILTRKILDHGEQDLEIGTELESRGRLTSVQASTSPPSVSAKHRPDVPSAQGHTLLYGETAGALAFRYGCEMGPPSYYFTQKLWDEHVDALEKERNGQASATWDSEEYLPQGTCGAVAMDEHGVICVATSTDGLTNKISGRVGDTPIPCAGYWADEWIEPDTSAARSIWEQLHQPAAFGEELNWPQ